MKNFLKISIFVAFILGIFFLPIYSVTNAQSGGLPKPTVVPKDQNIFNSGNNNTTNNQLYYNSSGQRVGGNSRFNNIQQVGQYIIDFIQKGLIPIIMALALLVFIFGILKFIASGEDETARTQGRQFMFWGIIGLTVMVSVWGLVQILAGTLGESVRIPTLDRLR